ncbi:MAG TPA: class I SAM-dependent methyltransferase [Jiangellales bacterium]|nr:class I SAM-dependent methyltransferase [Jiangellales bacterium]
MHSTLPDTRHAHRVFAWAYDKFSGPTERGPVGAARRRLVSKARGDVVDLGAGTGLNTPHLGSGVGALHLIEPDPHMLRRLRERVDDRTVLHHALAEDLPLPDASVDTVITTLTMCSVLDVDAAAREARRVLRPGGQLLVLEHVRSIDPRLAAWQDRLDALFVRTGGGCHHNRDTAAALAAAGFDTTPLERVVLAGLPTNREWLLGRLTR